MATLFTIFGLIYLMTLFTFIIGILRLSPTRDKEIKPISIIVAARNEELNIGNLIKSILDQDYPKASFELIIADDRSTDKTAKVVENFTHRFNLIKLVKVETENPQLIGKKGAIDAAIKFAQHEILAFTDADCIVGKGWLKQINAHFTDDVDFLAGYSFVDLNHKFSTGLKNIERASIFAVTSGSFGNNWAVTCAAGNMAYRKSIYNEIDGFSGIGHIRSGDDDLMLQKMRRKLRTMNFFFKKEAMVYTSNSNRLDDHIQRESRRASKWRYYTARIKSTTLLVFIFYILLFVATILTIIGKFEWHLLLFFISLKVAFETMLIAVFLHKIRCLKQIIYLPIAELIYIPYFIYFGLRGTFGKYRWK